MEDYVCDTASVICHFSLEASLYEIKILKIFLRWIAFVNEDVNLAAKNI